MPKWIRVFCWIFLVAGALAPMLLVVGLFYTRPMQFGLFGSVLVLMMLFRPDGFIPAARSKQVKKAEQELLVLQEEEINEEIAEATV